MGFSHCWKHVLYPPYLGFPKIKVTLSWTCHPRLFLAGAHPFSHFSIFLLAVFGWFSRFLFAFPSHCSFYGLIIRFTPPNADILLSGLVLLSNYPPAFLFFPLSPEKWFQPFAPPPSWDFLSFLFWPQYRFHFGAPRPTTRFVSSFGYIGFFFCFFPKPAIVPSNGVPLDEPFIFRVVCW